MSRSYHKFRKACSGYRENTIYFRSCARALRHKNRQMLRDLVPVCEYSELDETLYHIGKRGIYNDWIAPSDLMWLVPPPKFEEETDDYGDVHYKIQILRRKLIQRARYKCTPLHGRKKYSYKDILLQNQ